MSQRSHYTKFPPCISPNCHKTKFDNELPFNHNTINIWLPTSLFPGSYRRITEFRLHRSRCSLTTKVLLECDVSSDGKRRLVCTVVGLGHWTSSCTLLSTGRYFTKYFYRSYCLSVKSFMSRPLIVNVTWREFTLDPVYVYDLWCGPGKF